MLQASVLWKRAAGLWQKRAAERSLILRLEHFPDKSSVVARLPATGYFLTDRRRSSFYYPWKTPGFAGGLVKFNGS